MHSLSFRITTYALSAAFLFAGCGLKAQASNVSTVLPTAGINITLAKGTTMEDLQAITGNDSASLETLVELTRIEDDPVPAAEEPSEEESFSSLVIAQVRSYVNVRNMPSEDGQIVGYLYNNSVGTFLAEQNGWYEIQSGDVTGFVSGEYCVTGDAAVELAKQVGTRIATVTADGLYVRSEASLDASILGMVANGDDLVVYEEQNGWARVDTEDGMGWVSMDYVDLRTEFVTAESKEEADRRKAEEQAAAAAARAAAQAAAAQAQAAQAAAEQNPVPVPVVTASGDNEMGAAVAQYALQFVGNPYKYGGCSLTNGTDCSGFVMSVYANFGVSLPHSSGADRKQGYAVDGLENAQPGDLICYSGHVALYIGDGQIVHASNSKTGIITSKADYKKILAIRRIF